MIGKLFLATVIAFSGVCVAAKAETLRQCGAKADEKERLACFEKLAKQSEPSEQEETTSTPKVIEPKSSEYRVVDPSDIFVAYNKYVGKPIEVRGVNCYYADKDDYRCIAIGGNAVVFFADDIEPAMAREAIENDCGEVKKAFASSACKRTIRLTAENISDDVISGYKTRISVHTSSLAVVADGPVKTKTRKRR
jgi:hypothetical protein